MCEFIEALNQKVKMSTKWQELTDPSICGRICLHSQPMCVILFSSCGALAICIHRGELEGDQLSILGQPYVFGWQIDICNPEFKPQRFIKVYNKILSLISKKLRKELPLHDDPQIEHDNLNSLALQICEIIGKTLKKYGVCYEAEG